MDVIKKGLAMYLQLVFSLPRFTCVPKNIAAFNRKATRARKSNGWNNSECLSDDIFEDSNEIVPSYHVKFIIRKTAAR